MNPKEAAHYYSEKTLEARHYLHSHPELSFQEYNTARYIREKLTEMGIEYQKYCELGTVAEIGYNEGKTVLLRADMDALPIQEENEFSYSSCVPGVMHACGHDAHSAMLLTACRILKDMENLLQGKVRIVFQPSEENGKGARAILEDGSILKDVDACFACHIWSEVKSGQVAVLSGPVMAGANHFKITVKGTSSHGAAPHQGRDALTTAAMLVGQLQTISAREIDPQEPVIVTVGQFESGSSWNVIPDQAVLIGTTRCFSKAVNEYLPDAMSRMVQGICEANRCEGILEYTNIVEPTVNDIALSKLAQHSVEKIFGENGLGYMRPTSGGEDFSLYIQNIPGVMCMIGCYNPEIDSVYNNHHGKFKVDEVEMIKGAGLYAQLAVDFLNS